MHMKQWLRLRVVSFFLTLLGLLGFARDAAGQLKADFNGDGFADLAVGVPDEDVGTITNAGAVNVLYGSGTGLSAAGNQLWHQDSGGILDGAEADDIFGWALAAGDFNGDGFADLAVGVPGESVGTISFAGVVNVLYGSGSGLSATGNQLWHQDRSGVADVAEADDHFGLGLAP
jgi:FG-GAP repeat